MKYDYTVKAGGVYYAAGEEVPEPGEAHAEREEPVGNDEDKKPGRPKKAAGQ